MTTKVKRFSASFKCPKCKANVPITADEGAHDIECFKCGNQLHVFLGNPDRQLTSNNLKEA